MNEAELEELLVAADFLEDQGLPACELVRKAVRLLQPRWKTRSWVQAYPVAAAAAGDIEAYRAVYALQPGAVYSVPDDAEVTFLPTSGPI